jgi:hypothetical protein
MHDHLHLLTSTHLPQRPPQQQSTNLKMSFLNNVRNILPSISWLLGPPPPTGPFTPTYGDVCQTRALLKSLKLPTELVLSILEHAQYWPRHEISGGGAQAAALRNRPSAATLCLSINVFDTPAVQDALASGEHAKIRKIEFRVQSRDQGWTTERTQGTFSTSSWTEVSILRDASNANSRLRSPRLGNTSISCPQDYHNNVVSCGWSLVKRPESALQGPQGGEGDFAWYLQGNRVARPDSEEHTIVWAVEGREEGNEGSGSGEGFLQELREGDRVLVWARAKVSRRTLYVWRRSRGLFGADMRQWTGWQCIVEGVDVTISYGF